MSPAVREPCRLYGDFVPIPEVPMLLANGWRLVDDLAGDPLGADYALLQPPIATEQTA
jgi:hypothetical protein